jgi:hypothetical protein
MASKKHLPGKFAASRGGSRFAGLHIRLFFAIIPAVMEERANTILIAAAAIVAPRLHELKDSPALRCAVHDAIRVAEYMARVVDSNLSEKKPA